MSATTAQWFFGSCRRCGSPWLSDNSALDCPECERQKLLLKALAELSHEVGIGLAALERAWRER